MHLIVYTVNDMSFLCIQLVVAIETCHLAAAHVVAIGTINHVTSPIDR